MTKNKINKIHPILTSQKNDEYYTPRYLIEPILEFVNPNLKIWCPFDTKKSEFVKTFKENGFSVINSHLKIGQDFFNFEPKAWDCVISNPPFSRKYEILDKLLKINKPFGLIFGIQILNNGIFNKLVAKYKWNLQILTFTKRATYNGNNCSFMSAYFCNKLLKKHQSCYIVRNLEKTNFNLSAMYGKNINSLKEPVQLSLFGGEK